MPLFIYNIGILLYRTIASLLSLFNPKIKLFKEGRAAIPSLYASTKISLDKKKIWIHCASLGEFEQGRPIIEQLRENYKDAFIVVTFFSPSGYEVRKNYPVVDLVLYMDYDTSARAEKFVQWLQPDLAIFVKYEFWYHHLNALKAFGTKTLFIGTIFQPRHIFFKWYGGLHRKMLGMIDHLFVQDQSSLELLASIGVKHASIGGDPRFDQAFITANTPFENAVIEHFISHKVVVAGSTWDEDIQLLKEWYALENNSIEYQLIIAPHNITPENIQRIYQAFESYTISRYTQGAIDKSQVLILDTFGVLSKLYRKAEWVWIGGGWNKTGIHNSVEAAVYGAPLFWGPRYNRYREAMDLIAHGAAVSTENPTDIQAMIQNEKALLQMRNNALEYVNSQLGATQKIMDYIKVKCFSNKP